MPLMTVNIYISHYSPRCCQLARFTVYSILQLCGTNLDMSDVYLDEYGIHQKKTLPSNVFFSEDYNQEWKSPH